MLFDKLCGIVERHIPEWRDAMETARIFEFEDRSTGGFEINLEFMWDGFFLPFRVTSMESPGRLVTLIDFDENAVGLEPERGFISFVASSEFKYVNRREKREFEKNIFKGKPGYNVIIGSFRCEWNDRENNSFRIIPTVVNCSYYSDTKFIYDENVNYDPVKAREEIQNSDLDELTKHTMFKQLEDYGDTTERMEISQRIGRNLIEVVSRMAFINTPDRFVVEIDRTNVKLRNTKSNKITRSDERPKYVILRPDEIRRMIGVAQPGGQTGAKRAPHERRRHFRTLRSDRYVNKKGQTIIIPATWIGPSESIVKNKRYRVLFDI